MGTDGICVECAETNEKNLGEEKDEEPAEINPDAMLSVRNDVLPGLDDPLVNDIGIEKENITEENPLYEGGPTDIYMVLLSRVFLLLSYLL